MRAFVTELQKFFKLDTEKTETGANFDSEKRRLKIPMYQREYKWENERIEALISDVSKRDKFLGNVILDEAADSYEIVDGQQRITTCYLILVYLHNFYQGSHLEQESLLSIIKPYGNEYVLKNETVGEYLAHDSGRMSIQISADTDIYSQRGDFERAYAAISKKLDEVVSTAEDAREFKRKLLNSKILVLINEEHHAVSIEQIFLDINEKAQLLDTEDIFKGHCFEIFDAEFHGRLRQTWVDLKTAATDFSVFGVKSLSDYIYWFLLEHDSTSLPQKLNPNGKHYLEGKTMDETNDLLMQMIAFGRSNILFSTHIGENAYRFIDICENSAEYRNTDDHIALKAMSSAILIKNKTCYQKLPFMYFIYKVNDIPTLKQHLTHDSLRRIITNLYVYASLFALNSEKKKKKELIDHSIRDALRSGENQVREAVQAAKSLRSVAVDEYKANPDAKYDELVTVYSIMDNYISITNWISCIYSRESGYNLEHFVIPDQKAARIKWRNGEETSDVEIDKGFAKVNKKKACNYLIMDHHLNEELDNYDIVTKISKIREWYASRSQQIPKHMETIIGFIEELPEYIELLGLKETGASLDVIKPTYTAFLGSYFSEDIQSQLFDKLVTQFKRVFQN